MLTSEFLNDVKLSPMATLLAIIITAIGMISLFLVLLLYLTDNGIEKFHHDYPQVYRIETQFNLPNGEKVKSAQVPLPLIAALQNEKNIKDVAYALRLFIDLQVNGKTHTDVEIYAVSPNFLTTINPYRQKIPYLSQNEIIITPEFNRQYLHLNHPKGQVITLGNKGKFVIKDVVNLNAASRFNTHAVIAFSPDIIDGYHDKRHDWYDMHTYLFATMVAGAKPNNEQLKTLVTRYAPQLPGAPFSPEEFIQLSARNITDIHYDTELPDEMSTVISKSYLYTLYIAGFFIFLTTTMNFFNVNNIINTNKKSSFQIKKSVGASNYQLLTESFFIATLQAVCVLILAFGLLAILMQASENVRELILIQKTGQLVSSFSVAFFSLYIAILISHYLYLSTTVFPNKSWHNHAYNAHPISHYIYQVTLSIQIAIAGIIIYIWAGVMTQIYFMQNHTFGYAKENVVTFPLSGELKSLASLNSLQDALKNSVEASSIALSSWRPFDMSRTMTSVFHQNQQEQDKLVSVNILNVNKNFTDTWGIKTLAGHENPITPSKNNNIYHAIATKAFMSAMGKSSSDEVLNTLFYINNNDTEYTVRILRVVNDFYLADRDKNTIPLLILISDEAQRYGALKLQHMGDISTVNMILERYGVNADQIKLAEYIHQEYFNNHNLMKETISLVTLFSVALLLISTMIIGMAESQRISKILKIMESVGGSMYTHIVFFIQQNVTPVLVAVAIAFPIGFILLQKWLSKYNFINSLSYFYAFGTLLLFMVSILSVMILSLILSHTKKNK
ncbi:darobactin export ABC transporter permease subunit [Yersinia similis]|uniref:Membrane protein n=2 Tax=Yersinia similis TaxID=367190 RepID=A0A0T9NZZ1_9GAMM|nr:darobactin export ABC transporter permease subunit [Yersinia similis]CFQ47756.1 Membrane protein [Yersinia similis]CNF09660.1 Membrane protein [Yersinia similis]CNH36869.1 Membrane protein [Yersinia similis]